MLNLVEFLVGHRGVGTLHHCRNQVGILTAPATGLHRTARAEHSGDVQAHRRHQHTRCHLVTVRDTDHGISLVGIHHIFHGVGNDVAAGQRVEHTVVTHGNTVVDGNRIEFGCIASQFLDFLTHNLPNLVQMRMSGHELGERVDNGDDRLAELFLLHTCGQPTMRGHQPFFCLRCILHSVTDAS